MTANDIANMVEKEPYHTNLNRITIAYFIRQQQTEIEALEKENTDLRYLIATKLEQQAGISLNSMAHPVTNTPEPSYEIDPDKLETIEIDLPSPEPVAWMYERPNGSAKLTFVREPMAGTVVTETPLYTHPADLTDKEILSLTGFKDNPYDIFIEYEKEDLIEFARAILRKAQE